MALSEQRRQQLDGIVQKMVASKESDNNIKFVVDDFKAKYEGEQLKQIVTPVAASKKTGLFKGIRGFGETLGTAIASFGAKKQEEQETAENSALLNQVQAKLKDPNISSEQKQKLLRTAQGLGVSTVSNIPAMQKSTKQIAGEALGTLGTVGLGAAPAATVAKRIGFGTVYGAGAGLGEGLDSEKDLAGTLKQTVKGAATGAIVSGVFEGVGALLRKAAPKVGKNIYNKELQPSTKDLAADIKRNAETFGEQVRNAVDDTGKPIYQGGYKTMKIQAEKELSSQGKLLEDTLKQYTTKMNRNEVAGDIVSKLENEYGTLTKNQLSTVEKFIKQIPNQLDPSEALKYKRLFDKSISNTDWTKLASGDSQISFAHQAKYLIRNNLRKLINEKTADPAVQAINNRLGMAMEVRDLVSSQLATRAKQKISASGGVFNKLLGKLWDDILFSPSFTTRASQAAKRLGSKTGQTVARQAARDVLTDLLTK